MALPHTSPEVTVATPTETRKGIPSLTAEKVQKLLQRSPLQPTEYNLLLRDITLEFCEAVGIKEIIDRIYTSPLKVDCNTVIPINTYISSKRKRVPLNNRYVGGVITFPTPESSGVFVGFTGEGVPHPTPDNFCVADMQSILGPNTVLFLSKMRGFSNALENTLVDADSLRLMENFFPSSNYLREFEDRLYAYNTFSGYWRIQDARQVVTRGLKQFTRQAY